MAPKQAASSTVVVQCVASVNAVASVNSVANALSELLPGSTSATWRRKLAHDELYKSARAETPFGTVCQRSVVQGKRAELEIFHVNPFALLYQGAKESVMDFYDKVKSNVHQWYSEDWENANTDADKAVKAKSLAEGVAIRTCRAAFI